MWHKVIFKWSSIGLNSEFSFFLTSCYTKVKEHSLPYYLPIAGGELLDLYLSQGYLCYMKCKQPCPGFEVGLPFSFPMTVSITPLMAPLYMHVYMCMYVCMYVCVYMYAYVCMCVYVYMYVHICVYLYVCMYMGMCACECICVCIFVCYYTCMCVYVYAHVCVRMYICVFIYICMNILYNNNSVGVKKTQILQFANFTNWYLGKKILSKKKKWKAPVPLKNNQAARMSSQKKKHWQNYLS